MACHRGADRILDEGGVGGTCRKKPPAKQCACTERIHDHLAHTAIYARLNTKAVDRARYAQADRLCSVVLEPVVGPARG